MILPSLPLGPVSGPSIRALWRRKQLQQDSLLSSSSIKHEVSQFQCNTVISWRSKVSCFNVSFSSTAHTALHFFLRTTVHPSSSSGGGGSFLLTDGPDDSHSIAWTQKNIQYYLYSSNKQEESWIMWLMVWAAELWFTTCCLAVNHIVYTDKDVSSYELLLLCTSLHLLNAELHLVLLVVIVSETGSMNKLPLSATYTGESEELQDNADRSLLSDNGH